MTEIESADPYSAEELATAFWDDDSDSREDSCPQTRLRLSEDPYGEFIDDERLRATADLLARYEAPVSDEEADSFSFAAAQVHPLADANTVHKRLLQDFLDRRKAK